MKKLFLMLFCLFLASCDIKVSTPVKVSDLFGAETKSVQAILKFQLNGLESTHEEQIQKIEQALKSKGIEAKYQNKTEIENNQKFALFSTPLEVLKDSKKSTKNIYLVFENNELSIRTSAKFSQLLQHENSKDAQFSGFNLLLTNDTEKDVYVKTYSVFVDDKPVFLNNYVVPSNATLNIALSDVARNLIKNSSETYTVLLLNDDLEKLNKQSVNNLMGK